MDDEGNAGLFQRQPSSGAFGGEDQFRPEPERIPGGESRHRSSREKIHKAEPKPSITGTTSRSATGGCEQLRISAGADQQASSWAPKSRA
jgi:hypothetical protein